MWANEWTRPRFIDNIVVQSWKLLCGWQNGTKQHYVTLPGSTASCGECTQTCTFENHSNLHTYLTNWPLTDTVHSGKWLSKHYITPRRPFSKFCSNLLCAYCLNKLPEWGPTKSTALCTVDYAIRSIKSSLPSLYPLCYSRDKIYQALFRFSSDGRLGGAWERG